MEGRKMNKTKVILLILAWLLIPYIMVPVVIWNRCKYNKFTWSFLSGCITFILYFAIFINPGIQENKVKANERYLNDDKKIAVKETIEPSAKEKIMKEKIKDWYEETETTLNLINPTHEATETPLEAVKATATATATIIHTPEPTSTKKAVKTSSSKEYIVTFKFANLVENNHVGNDWGYNVSVNGTVFRSIGQSITIKSSKLVCKTSVVENDKIPDSSLNTKTLKLGDNYISNIVRENRGRYSGNTATWQFTINVKEK
jgi:hypothetical protein